MPHDVDSDGEESYPGGPIRFKYHNPLLGCLGAEFLPNAIPIPGSGHTVHNCMKSFPESMDHWDTFFKYLKIIERLLTHPGRRERMVARCVMGTPFAEYEKDLPICSAHLYEPRWGEVALFCQKAVRPIGIIRRCWSQHEYEENGKAK